MVTVVFVCGHHLAVDPDRGGMPRCPCGETRRQRTLAPAPRITVTTAKE